jgi:hypothetical protein
MHKLRHLILPSLLILCLAGGIAVSQTIVRAIQLSQDTTGAFSVDSNNGVYFPSHINTLSRSSPAIAGTGTPTILGSDTAGTITMGTSATTAVATFARAYLTVPFCTVSWQAPMNGTATPIAYTLATTSISISQGATTANKINYMCMSAS